METVPRMVEVGEWGELDATETKSFRVWEIVFLLGTIFRLAPVGNVVYAPSIESKDLE